MPRIAGFPGASDDKESACNVGDPGSWVRKIPWSRARQPAPVFLMENCMDKEPGRLQSLGSKESDSTEVT